MKNTFSSLKFFNYRVWFAAALVANVGTWMQRVAQDWLVGPLGLPGGSGVSLGIATALQFGPALVLSPYGGLLADRLNRRHLLMFTQGAAGLLAVAQGILVLSGHAQLWHIFVFATLLGIVSAIDSPVRQTFVAEMVPQSDITNAIGLNSASFNAARLIGPAISGLLIAGVGPGWVFIINGISFAATIMAMVFMHVGELHVLPTVPKAKGQMREGLSYVRHRTDIIVIMCVISVVSAFGLNFQLTSMLMATSVFGKGPGEYGILGSILAIGSLTGALMAARRDRPRVRLVIGSALAFGIAAGVMALMPTYLTYALASIVVGFCSLTMLTAANAAIQMSTAPIMRGRVMSLYMMVNLGATPIGAPLIGWIGESWGARWSIGVGAIASILVAVAAWIWASRRWNVRIRYRMHQTPHLVVLNPITEEAEEAALEADIEEKTALAS